MKVKYDIWYKKHGVRFVRQLLIPPMFDNKTTPLPLYSVVHYFRPYEPVTQTTEFLGFDKVVSVIPVYTNISPKYVMPTKRFNVGSYVKGIAKRTYVDILLPAQYKIMKSKKNHTSVLKHMVAYDYGYIRDNYKEIGVDKYRLYKNIQNEVHTLFNTILESRKIFQDVDHKHYIVMDTVSDTIPASNLLRLLKEDKLNEKFLHTFDTNSKLIYLELVKVLLNKSKVFDTKDIYLLNDIVLLLTNDNATVSINLYKLLSYSPAYPNIDGEKLSELRLLKLFNTLLLMINLLDPSQDVESQLVKLGVDTDSLENDAIDDVIDTTSKKVVKADAFAVPVEDEATDRGEITSAPVELIDREEYSKPIKKKMLEAATTLPKLETPLGTLEKAKSVKNIKADTTAKLRNDYVSKVYEADILKTVASLESSQVVLTDLKVTPEKSILGDTNKLEMKYLDHGKVTNISMILPVLKEDGIFKIAGVEYKLRPQKVDVPIKKIDWNTVMLSSVYSKLNVVKAWRASLDAGKQVYKLLEGSNDVDGIVEGTLGHTNGYTPAYATLSRHIKILSYKGVKYEFNGEMKDGKATLNKDWYVSNDMVHSSKSKTFKPIHIFQFFGIDMSELKKEYPDLTVYKEHIPLVWILIYFIGFKNLAKLLKLKYKLSDTKLDGYDIEVKFTDKRLYIKTDNVPYHLMYGLNSKKFKPKDEASAVLENKQTTYAFLHSCGLVNSVLINLKVMENGWVDPITKDILSEMQMPTELYSLLLKANEMLEDDNYVNPGDMKHQMFRGDERIAMFMYKALITAVKEKEANAWYGGAKIKVDPYDVLKQLNTDPAAVLMEDVNPLAYDKLVNESTMSGHLGRDASSIMAKDRGVGASAVGYLADSKDNSNTGTVSYLPAEPLLDNTRGITKDNTTKKLTYANILTTNNMLMPFITQDDGKRSLTSNIMASAIIPIDKPNIQAVRTNYEHKIIHRVPEKFGAVALEDGVITKITTTKLTVEYASTTKEYSIKSYTGKETSNASVKHTLIVPHQVKDKVKQGDVLYYDSTCFIPDILNPSQVLYCNSVAINTLLLDTDGTFEDGVVLSSKITSDLTTIHSVVIKDTILKIDTDISNIVTTGKVSYGSQLYSVDVTNASSDEIKEYIESTIIKPMKAKVKGNVIKVECFYNAEFDDLPKAIQAITDKKHKVNAMYSVNGVSLAEDSMHLKFFIEKQSLASTGDKYVVGNQLKCTVSNIMDNVTTVDGEDIDCIFGMTSVAARVVNSPMLMGVYDRIMDKIRDDVIKMRK